MTNLFKFTLTNAIEGVEVLDIDPIGWATTDVVLKRNSKWHGVFSEYALKLGFHCKGGGYDWMVNIKENQGIDADIDILVEMDCDGVYEPFFTGKVHLQNYEQTDVEFKANIIQSDVPTKIKAREALKVSMTATETTDGTPLTPLTNQWYDMNYHAKTIVEEAKTTSSTANYFEQQFLPGPNTPLGGAVYSMPPQDSIVTDELILPQIPDLASTFYTATQLNEAQLFEPYSNITGQDLDNFEVFYDIEARFNETAGFARNIGDRRLRILWGPTHQDAILLGNFQNINTYGGIGPGPGTTFVDVNETGTFTIPGGLPNTHSVWVEFFYSQYAHSDLTGLIDLDVTNIVKSVLSFRAETIGEDTVGKATAIHEGWAKVAQVITDQTDGFRSNLFGRLNSEPNTYPENGCASFTAITNGFGIRNFIERVPKISLKELYKSCNSVWNIGMGVEPGGSGTVLRVEDKDYFYDDEVFLTLNNVPDVKRQSFVELLYSLVEIGYKKYQNENTNGLDEPCGEHQYRLPLNNILPDKGSINEYKELSDFIASAYLIEEVRRKNVESFPNTDTDFDDNNFFVALNRSVDGGGNPDSLDIAEKDENLTSVSNLLDPPTVYNIRLTPKRNLLRHIPFLGASMTKKVGQIIDNTQVKGNGPAEFAMVDGDCPGEFSGVSLSEEDNIQWDDPNIEDGTPLFEPEKITFNFPLSKSEYDLIRTVENDKLNFYRTIRWTENKGTFEGYLYEVRYKPVDGIASFIIIPKYQ